MSQWTLSLISIFTLAVCLRVSYSADDSSLREGDRVVFIGNTLVEREQEYGDWELQLTLASEDKHVTFRNLGWSGDTVWAESRGMFDPPAKGYQRMLDLVNELKPTLIILGYGTVEAFSGEDRLEEFAKQYETLRSDLGHTGARFVHISPTLLEESSFPVHSSEASQHIVQTNRSLKTYGNQIKDIAEANGDLYVDFIAAQEKLGDNSNWTDNGIHLSAAGYASTAQILAAAISRQKVDSSDQEEIRRLIQKKNTQFFHRWRPQNFTYLFGFRKHEQGQNAVEIAQFDPIIAELERQIHQLKTRLAE